MDSELVIACHCKEKHGQLFFYNPDGSSRPLDGETYVDPRACPDKTWDKIPSNSKQIVWGQNCPIYCAFTKTEIKTLKEILEESYRVLKPGGTLFSKHPGWLKKDYFYITKSPIPYIPNQLALDGFFSSLSAGAKYIIGITQMVNCVPREMIEIYNAIYNTFVTQPGLHFLYFYI